MAMRVLIADDSLMMRRLLQIYLQKWDYEVVEAEDGAQAWELFQNGGFHLVVTDWLMPEMDGLELTRRIRSYDSPGYVYVILLTAKSEKEDLVAAMDAGADDFLGKPFNKDELRVRIREGERMICLERSLAEQNQQLRETQAALLESEKLASLGQLAAGMAHEINNPVSYVTNNMAVLNREVSDVMKLLQTYRNGAETIAKHEPDLADATVRLEQKIDLPWIEENIPHLLKSSQDGLARVRDIVKNLRDFAHLDEAELDELDVNEALRSTFKVLRREMDEKNLRLKTSFGNLPTAPCHPGRIRQVFYNVLLNAVQASESHATIEVETSVDQDDVLVDIKDQGCGIDAAHMTRIFEPFFTTKPVGDGVGLGLAVCYGALRDHGGSIEAESPVGGGCVIHLRIPIQPTD
jgi:two-component system, NtrC family, sensor kinase